MYTDIFIYREIVQHISNEALLKSTAKLIKYYLIIQCSINCSLVCHTKWCWCLYMKNGQNVSFNTTKKIAALTKGMLLNTVILYPDEVSSTANKKNISTLYNIFWTYMCLEVGLTFDFSSHIFFLLAYLQDLILSKLHNRHFTAVLQKNMFSK